MSDQGEMRERRTSGRSGRRRSTKPTLNTIYWRDIPAQITGRNTDSQSKVLLHARFQHAIDRAAAVAGLTSTDAYVQEWRTASAPLEPGDIHAQLDQLCAEIETAYPKDRLEEIVAAGGVDDASQPSTTSAADATSSPTTPAHSTTPTNTSTTGEDSA
jgi:hypothetical protein